jgi:hypothetical protein
VTTTPTPLLGNASDSVGAMPRPTTSARGETDASLSQPGLTLVWRAAAAVFGLQFVGLLVWSWHLWTRFDLSSDMATFSQAWQQIGSGHLSPYETTFPWYYPHYGYPFYQSHLELMMWPLALLHAAGASAFSLLVVQDLVLAGSGLVALRWGLELLDRHWPAAHRGAAWIGAGLIVLLVIDPWTYWTASFDFHLQPIGTFFALLAGRDIWLGRKRAWVWVVAVLMCGDVAATYLVALGLAALVTSPRTRRNGLVLVIVGIAWLGVVGLVHSGKGSSLSAGYGYLTGHTIGNGLGGVAAVVAALLVHPSEPLRILWQRMSNMYQYVAGAGALGIASPLGLAAVLVVLVPNALNQPGIYVSHVGGFQNFFVAMFVAVGSVQLVTWLAHRMRFGLWLSGAIAACALILAVVTSVQVTTGDPIGIRQQFPAVNTSTAHELSEVASQIPAQAEVIVSGPVAGRFGARRWVYFFFSDSTGQVVPVFGSTVYVVVVPLKGTEPAAWVASSMAAAAFLRSLGAHQIADKEGVVAFAWHRPRTTGMLTFP